MRIVYFGSGAFGLPTLKKLAAVHEIGLIVTQPDRPAGRSRRPTPTAIAAWAEANCNAPIIKPEGVNDVDVVDVIRAVEADAFVVIAYGQKLGQLLLAERFAINLHGSILPKFRGAAPINWAIIRGERSTGLSVITLADRMDAGDVLGQTVTNIDPMETAGELHDRLAELGPELVCEVLARHEAGTLVHQPQDDAEATFAPKLAKAHGTVSFDNDAAVVRARVHGLTPWPGCRVRLSGQPLRLHRVGVADRETEAHGDEIGTIVEENVVCCARGRVRLLAVHPAGGKMMSFSAFRLGHDIGENARLLPIEPVEAT